MTTILFLHPNYPAQFRSISAHLASKGYRVFFLTTKIRKGWHIPGITTYLYKPEPIKRNPVSALSTTESHAKGAATACIALQKKGFKPDIIYGASGWGGTWFLRDIFPQAKLIGYFEWFYHADSADIRFGNNKEPSFGQRLNLRLRNTVIVNDLLACDRSITPTEWQKKQFPKQFQDQLHVIHDGVDIDYFSPLQTDLAIKNLSLTGTEEIISWATRGMEPYRGFPQFIEALSLILQERKHAHVIIAGENRSCYGSPPANGGTWKEYMLRRVKLPLERVHFTGGLPYGEYRNLLRCSSVHIYLTRPFVLSWSMLEAMSCGCLLVTSATEPVEEVVKDNINGLLCDFPSPQSLAERTLFALEHKEKLEHIKEEARQTICQNYGLYAMLKKQEESILQW